MLSMINPDSLTRYDTKFSGNLQQLQAKNSHENFYHEELDDQVHNSTLPTKPGTAGKTLNNFYHAQ
jgi:hypothetical protein